MNEYQRVEMMEDKRWTNILKCDIMENITKLGDAEQNDRFAEMDVNLVNENIKLQDMKKNIGKYYEKFKVVNGDFKDIILSGAGSKSLLERYRHLRPDQIKLSMNNSIHTINNASNARVRRFKIALKKLEDIHRHPNPKKGEQQHIKRNKMEATMGKIVNKVKRIALVDSTKRTTKNMVDGVKQNLIKYDTVIEQLQNDAKSMAVIIMKEIETGTNFNQDTVNYVKSYFAEKDAEEKSINTNTSYLDKINAIMDSMERSRKSLMQEKPATKTNERFYSKLPWTIDTTENSDIAENYKNKETKNNNNNWCSNISRFGIMYYVHPEDKTKFLNNLKNDINVSSIDYKFPENIFNYVTLSDIQPTNDELAADYILNQSEYNNIEDLVKYVECTKNDLINLSKLSTLRTSLRSLLLKERLYKKETIDKLKLLTIKDIEFTKQVESFKTFIDGQNKKMSDLEKMKTHYLKLFNDLYFYVDNIKIILKKLDVSIEDSKQFEFIKTLTSQENTIDTGTEELMKSIEDIKSMIVIINGKFRWCNLIIPDEFDSKQLNFARAMYVYKVQEFIQTELTQKQIKLSLLIKKNRADDMPKKSEYISTRDDMKRQAELIVKMFNEKDTDSSKNKRKPISFRKSFI
ncbi:uncharacterized protein LOC100572209 [Acyrthosiphon pisum]|uniref:Uncharacterized protein n=1 Tax=Acyrthosiphon pisum TaxID=7029 RepID=A0A8R2ABI5_ACYPI|nr:uncharacterized protein LOC100572209 [Acyrthosiphon pisum]|eukprot:XP_003243194.1 PREDICTED: uncharacterized protein LOC100572209 [Acyrthosiphon pisum]